MFGRRMRGRPSRVGRDLKSRGVILFLSGGTIVVAAAALLIAASHARAEDSLVADAAKPAPAADVETTSSTPPASERPQIGKKAPDFGYPQVALINEAIHKGWKDHHLLPSKPATDNEWCRRVYLDILGRVPKVDELTAYLKDKSRDKRADLVDRLLGEEYSAE